MMHRDVRFQHHQAQLPPTKGALMTPLMPKLIPLYLVFLVPSAVLLAEQPDSRLAEFEPLFDGRSLDAFVQKGGKARYELVDGVIVGTSVPKTPNSFLCTKKSYGDFILELEFKVDGSLNSGVQFRSEVFDEPREIELGDGKTRKVAAGRVHGYQCEIDCNPVQNRWWAAGVYDEGRRGWLFPGLRGGHKKDFTEQGRAVTIRDDWNDFRIEAIGSSIKTYLNGTPRADFTDEMTPRGFIALQVHGVGNDESKVGKQVRWRNLRIKDLSKPQ